MKPNTVTKVIVNPAVAARKPFIPVSGTGLGPNGRPVQPGITIANPANRAPNYRAKPPR